VWITTPFVHSPTWNLYVIRKGVGMGAASVPNFLPFLFLAQQEKEYASITVKFCTKSTHHWFAAKFPAALVTDWCGNPKICKCGQIWSFWPRSGDRLQRSWRQGWAHHRRSLSCETLQSVKGVDLTAPKFKI